MLSLYIPSVLISCMYDNCGSSVCDPLENYDLYSIYFFVNDLKVN